jgi:multimeric flavodoxin WrbA
MGGIFFLKILFLNASLRRHGTTEGVIDFAIEHLNETFPSVDSEVIHLCEKRIDMCDSCYDCEKGICWMKDDVHAIVQSMLKADGIVYAFPVHAFGVNSLMQAFLERAGVGYLRFQRPLNGKLASVFVTGRRYSHELAWSQIVQNIMLNKMILVGSGFPAVIRNDGKTFGDKIMDPEGCTAVQETLNTMVEMHFKLNNIAVEIK